MSGWGQAHSKPEKIYAEVVTGVAGSLEAEGLTKDTRMLIC